MSRNVQLQQKWSNTSTDRLSANNVLPINTSKKILITASAMMDSKWTPKPVNAQRFSSTTHLLSHSQDTIKKILLEVKKFHHLLYLKIASKCQISNRAIKMFSSPFKPHLKSINLPTAISQVSSRYSSQIPKSQSHTTATNAQEMRLSSNAWSFSPQDCQKVCSQSKSHAKSKARQLKSNVPSQFPTSPFPHDNYHIL